MNRVPSPIRILLAVFGLLVMTYAGAQQNFDHFSTGFELDGAHRTVNCESCHVGAVFTATDPRCINCHSAGGTVRSSQMPPNHPSTTGICEDCHTTSSWAPVYYMDHTAVIGDCRGCHNGLQAAGKPINHPVSGDNCDDCHQSVAWFPAVFDHANVTAGCYSCHNGVDATGKGVAHIQSTNLCEDCHSSSFWQPATMVDHTQVMGSCASCHNGVTATGKNPGHIASGDNCDD